MPFNTLRIVPHPDAQTLFFRFDGQIVIAIRPDGTVELADHMTVDDAARAFWHAVRQLNPLLQAPMCSRKPAPADDRVAHKPNCASLHMVLLSFPPKPAPCDCGADQPVASTVKQPAPINKEATRYVLGRCIDEYREMQRFRDLNARIYWDVLIRLPMAYFALRRSIRGYLDDLGGLAGEW